MNEYLITNRDHTFIKLVRVKSVTPLTGFTVHVRFTDGSERDIDLEKYLEGPVFEPIRKSQKLFRQVRIEGGTVAWPNDVDIDPDALYYGGEPPWAREQGRASSRKGNPRRPAQRTQPRVHRPPKSTRARKKILT